MLKRHTIGIFIIGVLLLNLFIGNFVQAVGSETPTISYVKNTVVGTNDTILVSGSTVANSEVLVYVDGSFVDFAEISKNDGNELNYYYKLNKDLFVGKHKLMIIGRDKTSLVLSPPSKNFDFNFYLYPVPTAPTVIFPVKNSMIGNVRPMITGLTNSATFVSIYLDGQLSYQTKFLYNQTGTANFAYQPDVDLMPGNHVLLAIAEDKYGQKSTSTNIIEFSIGKLLPAPTLIRTIERKNSEFPVITGLVKNGLNVKVFIDNKLDGTFRAKDDKSGTANFAYIPSSALTKGKHWVYTTTIDANGKESGISNSLEFTFGKEITKNIPLPVTTEKNIKTPEEKNDSIENSTQENEEKTEPKNEENKNQIDNLIKNSTTTKEANTGIIDESSSQQSKLKLNLLIFILFLLAVIGWIFWVNRELIKERKSENPESKTENDEKKIE